MDGEDIRRNLENEYDIPFVVTKFFKNGEPVFIIGPEDEGKELFNIRLSFQNKVRLYMEFVPQKYSAMFIESMAYQPLENRRLFIKYVELFNSMDAKCSVYVNGMPLNLEDVSVWPDYWKDFKLKITKMPIVSEGDVLYTEVANKWGSLMMGMVLSLADIVPIDSDNGRMGYSEGEVRYVKGKRYERNPLNRKLCLSIKGYNCVVCGMNFEKVYGLIGHNYIHVHHIVPVSRLGKGYVIDPVADLVPICPNCHSMLHKKEPPFLPEEMIEILKERE